MNTYFIYFDNPRNPNGVKDYLEKYKAEPFEIGYVIKSDAPPRDIYLDLYQKVINKGFTYVTNATNPEQELSFPPSARTRYLRQESDLDKAVCKFLGTHSKDYQ
jgi:hypothetical protein